MHLEFERVDKYAFRGIGECLIVPVFQGAPVESNGLITPADHALVATLAAKGIFSGKAEEVYSVPTPQSPYHHLLLLGIGKREDFISETLRRSAGKACEALAKNQVSRVVFDAGPLGDSGVEGLVEGIMLGQYCFDRYKQSGPDISPKTAIENIGILHAPGQDAVRRHCKDAVIACENANWARDLAGMPPNELTPTHLTELAKELAKAHDWHCEVLDESRMTKLGMNALLGVARGSEQRANLIVLMRKSDASAKTIALVGKGITFDTGGISIKPAEAMHEMKYDMCGAAAVLGAMKALHALEAPVNVVCVVPAAENMPGANAQRPGDIVRAYNGKTIEVHNTDAEGRLILADALAYAVDKYHPDQIVDLATLTGACVVALGHYAAGLLSTNDGLASCLQRAGDETGERVWRLPLWKDYAKLIEGAHADLCNIGPRGEAGTIVGACFLREFVGDTPWAHLDIAGTAWGGKHVPYLDTKYATGYGVRLLTRWVLNERDAA
ncbi:MAG: leucyl aminopeptidase [Candidatus Hydrogenedentes bacterium]|nr:leucyl aminopeptidase [Candidatus Hydrogenedentota bacterium]